jgi:hypothetical protein
MEEFSIKENQGEIDESTAQGHDHEDGKEDDGYDEDKKSSAQGEAACGDMLAFHGTVRAGNGIIKVSQGIDKTEKFLDALLVAPIKNVLLKDPSSKNYQS